MIVSATRNSNRVFAALLAALVSPWTAAAEEWPSLAGPDRWRSFREDKRVYPSLAIEDAYRAVLAAWAAGSYDEAVEALADLERRFLVVDDAACFERIRDNTLEGLAGSDPEALVPVLALYLALWEWRVHRESVRRAERTRREAESLLELYVSRGPPEARAVAARLLVHWAYRMIAFHYLELLEGSVDVLEDALGYEPENVPALHLSAYVHERLGEYESALALLERLLAIRPDHEVARLRHAVNLARTGSGAATTALAAVARSDVEPWIRIVAYSELIRLHSDRGRSAEAVAAAREALGRFPESERLAIQLAFLLRGSPEEGTEAMLSRWNGDAGDTPRVIYVLLPEADIRPLQDQLGTDIGRRRAVLRTTLDRLTFGHPKRKRFLACRGKLKLLE